MDISDSGFYFDANGLSHLKREVKAEQTTENIRQVAQQFESLFLNQVLKSMREASPGTDIFASKSSLFYRDMLDKQLSVSLSSGGGIGLADVLVEQLTANQRSSSTDTGQPMPQLPHRPQATNTLTPHTPATHASTPADATIWASPEDFVTDIWPHAQRAAQNLNVNPHLIVAQAALETGWGQHVPMTDGKSSFNFFGIKADQRWPGHYVERETMEYESNQFSRQQARFRAYDSMAEGVNDFVDFLKSQPRYRNALQNAHDDRNFLQALQHAGYATDPNYADKIMRIARSETLQNSLTKLKENGQLPLAS